MCCSESTWLKPRGFAAQPCPALVSPMALRCPAAMNPDPHHLCCTSSLNYRLLQLVAAFSYSSPGLHTCSNPTARATRGPLGSPGSTAAAVHRRRGSSFILLLLSFAGWPCCWLTSPCFSVRMMDHCVPSVL